MKEKRKIETWAKGNFFSIFRGGGGKSHFCLRYTERNPTQLTDVSINFWRQNQTTWGKRFWGVSEHRNLQNREDFSHALTPFHPSFYILKIKNKKKKEWRRQWSLKELQTLRNKKKESLFRTKLGFRRVINREKKKMSSGAVLNKQRWWPSGVFEGVGENNNNNRLPNRGKVFQLWATTSSPSVF